MATITREIHKIDAEGKILGRLATEIATLLRGKHKVGFTTYQDLGDVVIITNPAKIKVTGNKLEDKMYYRHSTYPGALKERNLAEMLKTQPEKVITLAVKNMMPKNRLSQHWLKRLQFEYTNAN